MKGTKKQAEALIEVARDTNIKIPRSKKESIAEAKAAIEASGAGGDEGYDQEAALKVLQDKFGKDKDKSGAKRKVDDSGDKGNGKTSTKAAKKKASAETNSTKPSVLDEEWDASEKDQRKKLAAKLVEVAKNRGVKVPEDATQARLIAGKTLMGLKDASGMFKVKDAVQELEDSLGTDPSWVDPDNTSSPKKKKVKNARPCNCPENEALAALFDEMADFAFKEEGNKSGPAYKNVVKAIKELDKPMTSAPKKGEIKGIGAKTIDKIQEYLDTGKIEALEEKRAAALEV